MNLLALFAVLLMVTQAPLPVPRHTAYSPTTSSSQANTQSKGHDAPPAPSVAAIQSVTTPEGQNANGDHTKDNATQTVVIREFPTVSISKDWADRGVWWFSLCLVVVGGLQAWFLYRTLGAISQQANHMERQTGILEKSVTASEASAKAALLNAQALINSERAWMLIELRPESNFGTWRFYFRAKNFGNSPAEVISIFGDCLLLDGEEEIPKNALLSRDKTENLHSEWIPPGETVFVYDFEIEQGDAVWIRMQAGKKKLWLYGILRYRDSISRDVRETRFCYWNPSGTETSLVIGGPDGFNEVT